jgi:hypothetical protein
MKRIRYGGQTGVQDDIANLGNGLLFDVRQVLQWNFVTHQFTD